MYFFFVQPGNLPDDLLNQLFEKFTMNTMNRQIMCIDLQETVYLVSPMFTASHKHIEFKLPAKTEGKTKSLSLER